jgi:hypothetical protein
MLDDEEIVKALSLEEKALDEFKRRKNSCPASSSQRSSDGKKNIIKYSTSFHEKNSFLESDYRSVRSQSIRSTSAMTTRVDQDLISFASEPQTSTKPIAEDPYNKLKESILKLSTPQPNLQVMPYQKPQQPSLSPESLSNLYSMNQNINHYYSQNMYFHPQTSVAPYPAIGFSHFMQQQPQQQQQNYQAPSYGFINYQQNYNWTQSTPTQPLSVKPSTSASPAPQIVPQVMKPTTSENLIDFDVDDSKYDANILQTFDPLIRNSTEEAENTYYTDQDPFDYIYSGGTQYSDPLYEAVVRSDHSLASPKSTPQDVSEYYIRDVDGPPPLPPRNLKSQTSEEVYDHPNGSAPRFAKKLYENVTHLKKIERDLTIFYSMVKELRSKYSYDDESSNIGHIIAAELDSKYNNELTSIKLLVYPSYECFQSRFIEPHSDRNQETYQKLDGYANPIVFTCDINSNILHVISHVLCVLEGEMSGAAEEFALKTIGSQEWLSHTSSLSHLEYIQNNIKLEKDIQLGLFPKKNVYMKILARTETDDLRDADIKFENILPKEAVSSISYDSLMILLETLELEIDKLEGSAADGSSLHSSGVVQAVKAICALLGCIDTLELFIAINNLKEACQSHSQSYHIRVSSIFDL